MTPADLERTKRELREAAEKATPAPWHVEYAEIGPPGSPDVRLVAFVQGQNEEYIVVDEEPSAIEGPPSLNAELIALLRNHIIPILDDRDRLKRELDAANARVRELEDIADSKAGHALRVVRSCFERQEKWTTRAIFASFGNDAVGLTRKQVYNALGYLTRHGQIEKLSYGEYRRA